MKRRNLRALKAAIFILCLVPLFKLAFEAFGIWGLSLGANPIEELLHRCGKWGLNFLLITLAVTPVRRLARINWLIHFRRMLGLFAFFYILMHFAIYAVLDQGLSFNYIIEDVVKRPYITLGMAALLMLIALAVTSTNKMMRRLGRNWQKLHRLVYVIAILGVWHFYWQVKGDEPEPLVYAGILAVLFAIRLAYFVKKKKLKRKQNADQNLTRNPT
ncbi:MAG TPA: protein-methionine-sulfoxide reductase heme-binding subunit MsrQ [Xanthomonadales bacterium]|nr:protein-methionine-sulfoxide reductase heme-binding subunit MsrQ [Xanthomonadales bacterium]